MYRFQSVRMCRPYPQAEVEVSYGILAQRQTSQGWEAVAVAGDVSCDQAFVCALAEKCTAEQLEPLHLADVVQDTQLAMKLTR